MCSVGKRKILVKVFVCNLDKYSWVGWWGWWLRVWWWRWGWLEGGENTINVEFYLLNLFSLLPLRKSIFFILKQLNFLEKMFSINLTNHEKTGKHFSGKWFHSYLTHSICMFVTLFMYLCAWIKLIAQVVFLWLKFFMNFIHFCFSGGFWLYFFVELFLGTMSRSSRTIYVGNLPGDIREREVEDLFYKVLVLHLASYFSWMSFTMLLNLNVCGV